MPRPAHDGHRRTLVLGIAGLLVLHAPARAQDVVHLFTGPDSGERLGWAAGGGGDVDADGVPDIVGGAPRADINGTSSGSIYAWSGATGALIFASHGDGTSDQFGRSCGDAADLDGDGHAEVLVGAPFDDDNGLSSGLARVLDGDGGATRYSFHGDSAEDYLGTSIAIAGDVDNDGMLDVIAGASQENSADPGYARIYSGDDGTVIRTLTGGTFQAQFGISVSGAGDWDADGHAEVIVGAWLDDTAGISRGRAFVFSGIDGSVVDTFEGEFDFDWFGYSVAGAGDVDDDGTPDVIVGGYGTDTDVGSDSGRATVFSGATGATLLQLDGLAVSENAGWSVDGAGDVDGDGHADLLVGAPFSDTGAARLHSGFDGAVLLDIAGAGSGDVFGRGVVGLGDLNGDGHGDFAVGAPLADDASSNAGSVTVLSGFPVWADVGQGLAGVAGVPSLSGMGTLLAGTDVVFSLESAAPSSSATLVVGFSLLGAPFKGGTLVPAVNLLLGGLPTDAAGALQLSVPFPAGVPFGFTLWFQAWIADAAAPANFSASNGLSATAP